MTDILIKKKIYTWQDVEKMCVQIVNKMYADCWRPDYIVGITRGGNVSATIISNMTAFLVKHLRLVYVTIEDMVAKATLG